MALIDDPLELGPLAVSPGGSTLERVTVRIADASGSAVSGVELTASSTEPLPASDPETSGWFRSAPAVELEAGLYELWLLPGHYAFRAAPPPTAPVGVAICVGLQNIGCYPDAEIGPGLRNDLQMELPPKAVVLGTVIPKSPANGGGSEIRALPIQGSDGRMASTVANQLGFFELALDAGDYDLVVIPASQAAPWHRQRLRERLFPGDERREDLMLSTPALVVGTVRTADAAPLARALVRAIRLDAEGGSATVGEAVTDVDGTFSLVLAAD
ncbi:carboxypeptidase-like regulatory domain-containing protein [Vulgatibacter incomptus]|uniref:Carboxypeptidase regulatory-like domain-containing protein n=1 Tax=Vulgatibacter incomptus TaxID=1391653 RepID=A0A0K1PA34_9BACT|nr:carboxypeptidase-like regulatory domain-containing protein [Vulgatibacter incomptus]AKU90398.1 hypothetical protein AKJ08_0785 [Vulgatibacter incomptus]